MSQTEYYWQFFPGVYKVMLQSDILGALFVCLMLHYLQLVFLLVFCLLLLPQMSLDCKFLESFMSIPNAPSLFEQNTIVLHQMEMSKLGIFFFFINF